MWPAVRGMVSVQKNDASVETWGSNSGGRLLLHERTEGGAVASSMVQQKIPFAFYILRKNSKLPLGLWGQIFNVAVTLNRNIQFKWCKAMW